jgi:hypothetical protein
MLLSARDALVKAPAAIREIWEPETTARTLRLIREACERRTEAKPWMLQIETELANIEAPPCRELAGRIQRSGRIELKRAHQRVRRSHGLKIKTM